METSSIAKALAELGNETRLEIFRLLVKSEPTGLNIGEIGERLSVPASTLAFHLRGLVSAELVTQTKQGRTVTCRANLNKITTIISVLEQECCIDNQEPTND
ncbi:ArsR/SmtB family transcription factor [Sneathiella glossodoripedis]|uniref:ArsR/SmtB family transcription factor n=1 Tax=Sneathiella glossodoripedis TaxID=418853 RepID=UPI0004729313|nr:metalloregulator ArsR/SmtB family transcription factor [Sneathiella glossodoripedis]